MRRKSLIMLLCVVFAAFACSGCLGTVVKPASDKPQIVVSVYDGGVGTDWIDEIIEEFTADYPEYDVDVEKRKRTVKEIRDLIALGRQADVYFSTVSDFHAEIYNGNLVDMSDILEMKVDGDDRTIGSKLKNADTWKKISARDGEGVYMLPYDDGVLGFNYDHEKFLEYGLMHTAEASEQVKAALTAQGITFEESGGNLVFRSATSRTNYNDGDVILRAGKDGKYGTYDDGQPVTMDEWRDMFTSLSEIGKSVIYSGKVVDYTTDIFNAAFAQYDGLDAWKTFNSYEGDYAFEGDSQPTRVTMQDGYKVYGMTGIRKATEFLQTWLNNKSYVHESSFMSEESHTDAQGKFVIGAAKTSTTSPFTGFLVDGAWWENESQKLIFKDLTTGSRPNPDFAYGTRDYRMMLLPQIEGQKGIDGQGNGSVLAARSTGSVIITKNNNPAISEMAKKFVSYTLKDKYLRHFTKTTGSIRPYEYDITDEDRASMTKYANTVWDMVHDTQNVAVIRPLIDRYVTPLPYKSSKGYDVNWMSKIGAVSYNMPISALRASQNRGDSDPVKVVFEGFKTHFQAAWSGFMNEIDR